jgi:hypothetical protein
MHPKILKLCGWSGAVAVVLIGLSFWGAGFIPIPSPSQTAAQTAQMMIENKFQIRIGMIVSMISSGLLVPYAVALTIQMRRIEGNHSPLAYIQLGAGSLLALEFIYLIFFWQAATFRPERSPELIQLLNDMAWIPFVGLSSTLILQAFVFGVAVLIDNRVKPIFPRWLGFFSLFSGFMFIPGTFNVFFLSGPFSWNGLIAIYIPAVIYLFWTVFNCIYLVKAVDHLVEEEGL